MITPRPIVPAAMEGRAVALGRFGGAFAPRTIAMLLFGLAWLIPAFVDRRFIAAMLAWDGIVLVAWLIDLWRLPSPGRLTARRTWLAPAALSVKSEVEIAVANTSHGLVLTRIIDTVPARLRADPPQFVLPVPAGDVAQARYAIEPTARGQTALGPLYIRYRSALQLAERWTSADLSQTVVTYPNIEDAARHSVYLIRSRQIALERRLTRVRGRGRAFESLREYREGDEFRDICWTASARRGKPVTRLYEIERSQTIWLLIDSGRLMRARVGRLSKLDYAVNAALALAGVALGSGDQVGVLAYGRRVVQRLAPGRGSAHLRHLIEHLAAVREDEWEADHLLAAGRLLADQTRRSLVVWITDLAETAMTPEVVRAATHVMAHHVVLFIVIGEPELQALARRTPDTVEAMYDTAAAQEVVHRRELLLAKLRQNGALALETTAAGLSLAVVNGYLDIKQRGRV